MIRWEDSTTYMEVFEKGEARGLQLGEARGLQLGEARGLQLGEARGESRGLIREAQATILRLGAKRFGPATVDVDAAVRAIDDHPRLERIVDRLLDATDWTDLLATA